MKKARLPILVQDPILNKRHKIRIIEGYDAQRQFFLDGPVTDRVAVLDFDPGDDELVRGVHFNKGKKRGWFEDEQTRDIRDYLDEEIYSPAFMQTSAFATVLKTLDLFNEQRGMGRPLTWAFNSPQLLVIPRAGEMANAYYQRDSHSIQFFYFPSESEKEKGKVIYSCLSRDIVAHETGHAIIDGIAPSLMDSASPQSLAIHEALADIIAMLVAFSSRSLTKSVLDSQNGSIKKVSALSTIAEEFGQAHGRREGLRNLLNRKTLNPGDVKNCVRRTEPHELSEVLSGALYNLMVNIHESLKNEYKNAPEFKGRDDPLFSASGKALGKAVYRFIRIVFRALDYLPIGCVSFADFGRAMIAVDKIAYPMASQMRDWIREEFLRRHIVEKIADLAPVIKPNDQSLGSINAAELHASDWIAYEYANAHRDLLGIPKGIPFQVHSRLDVTKRYDGDRFTRECIFKVSWEQEEENIEYPGLPARRKVTVGSTVVFDWENGRMLTILSNARPEDAKAGQNIFFTGQIRLDRQDEYENQKKDRDDFIEEMAEKGALRLGPQAAGPDGKPLPSAIHTEVINDVMKLKNTFNLLHIAEVD